MHITDTQNAIVNGIDTLRSYEPHEPHEAPYWAAQRAGFAIIKSIEWLLAERDQYAGRYTGWFNPHTEDYEDITDCSGQFEGAHRDAVDLAADACLGNAYGIIVAQGRKDEVAQLIRAAFDREAEARNRAAMTD